MIPFSRLLRFNPGACVRDGYLDVQRQAHHRCGRDQDQRRAQPRERPCRGGAVLCAPERTTGPLPPCSGSFRGLEHRLEFVREKDGVAYINDSKGTNVGAVVKSVEGFTQPVILIAGGLDKGSDFSPLYELFKQKVKLLILIGKAADKMAQALGTATETVFAQRSQDAVKRAAKRAGAGRRRASFARRARASTCSRISRTAAGSSRKR